MDQGYFEAVAAALGGTYEQRGDSVQWGYITLADGVRIFVQTGTYGREDRVEVSSAYPQHEVRHGGTQATSQRDFLRYGEHGLGSITFSTSKSPAAAARDIERRYLPAYRDLWARAVAFCDGQAAYHAGKRDLETAAKQHLAGLRHNGSRVYADLTYAGGTEASVSVHNLTVADIEKLAAFLATL